MVYLPDLVMENTPLRKQIIDFQGYSVAPVIEDGEMRNMENLSSDRYPNLSQRGARGYYTVHGVEMMYPDPEVIFVKNGALAVITKETVTTDGGEARFFYGYEEDDGDWRPVPYPNVALSELPEGQHKMVSIGKRICIWPEKLWFNVDTGESGDLGTTYQRTASASNTIVFNNDTLSVCTVTFNNMTETEAETFGALKQGDAVDMVIDSYNGKIHTLAAVIQSVSLTTANNSTTGVVTFPGDTFLSVFGTTNPVTFNNNGKLIITRYVPDLDYVMESGNRLWGCYENRISCCKLGDPTNWHYYQGLSVDSFELEVGTDGPWTGCVQYPTHLLFFKENYIHKVFGTTPATYQTQQSECYGVEKGSDKSVCVINGTVFYKSKIGIMAYGGTLPEHISSNFGNKVYTNAIAGTDGAKYYVNMKTTSGKREQLVFDLNKTMWHKESDMDPVQYAYLTNDTYNEAGKNHLLFLHREEGGNRICSVTPYVPFEKEEDGVAWMAELGPFDEFFENKKIYSKLKMRMKLDPGAELNISIKFDTGDWRTIRHIYQSDDRAAYVPISPVRCDKFYVKLEGKGNCVVESLVREYRERSER